MVIYAALGAGGLVLLLVTLIAGIGDHDVPMREAAFGIRVAAAFVTFFGVGGIIGQHLGWGHPGSSSLGLALALMAGTLAHRLTTLLRGASLR